MKRHELIKEDILRSASVLLIVGILVAIVTLPGLINPARVADSALSAQESSYLVEHGETAHSGKNPRKLALSSPSLETNSIGDISVSSTW